MDEIEDSTEGLHEKIHEEAHHAEHDPKSRWILWVALFTALVSVLAAITGMLSGHHENEALINQMKASDQWAFYQAKGIKAEIVSSTLKLGNNADASAKERLEKYKAEQEDIKQKAEEYSVETEMHLSKHGGLAKAITLFQITIAISAISILTRRKLFWYIGMVFALGACYFLLGGLL